MIAVSLVAVPATAQTNTTTVTPGNSTGNESAGNVTPSNGGGLINVNPWQWTKQIALGLVGELVFGAKDLVDRFNAVLIGLPAPGETTNVGSWSSPSNGQWPGVWETYWIVAGLSLSILPICALIAQSKPERERRELHRQQTHQFVLILGGWVVCAFALHTADAISVGLAPSGGELMNSYGSVSKLGLGVVVGVLLLVLKTGVVLLGIFVLVAEYWLAHLLVAFWPLFCAFRGSPIKSLRSFGDIGIATFGTLLLLKIFQSGVLRFLYSLEWTLGSGDHLVGSLVATTVGLSVALLGAPILFIKKVVPSGMLIVGGSLKQKPEQAAARMRNRATESTREFTSSARSRVTSSKSPSPTESSGNSRPSSGSTSGSTDTQSRGFETLANKLDKNTNE